MSRRLVALGVAAALLSALAAAAAPDPEALRQAKALFFDRQYAEARAAWQGILDAGGVKDAPAAPYWIARCSENLGESERALSEYGHYLDTRPADRALVEEAKTSRVSLAVKLAKQGQPAHTRIAFDSLSDVSRTVRYFTALQVASLGPPECRPALPVLKEILAKEKDEDLAERSKLALLKCDATALPPPAPAPPRPAASARPAAPAKAASWVHIRIYEKGESKPNVAINLPVALADLVFKSLPDSAMQDLRREGYDARSFWEALKKTGPAEILTVEGKDGERIQVWLE
jgi:tetratricopeptide (TPR) repeat protein